MPKILKRSVAALLLVVALLGLLLAALSATRRHLAFDGLVLFGWDSKHDAVRVLYRPRLQRDGPHVFREGDAYRVVETIRVGGHWALRDTLRPAHAGTSVEVQVDNPAATRFEVALRPPAAPAAANFPADPARLLMLSDFEGEFDAFVRLLRAQGVIDRGLHWRYGKGHVALVGDFVDRGEHVLPLLWLIYRLEGEAAQAGGRVHYVLGNHELMVLSGDMDHWPDRLIATAQTLGGDGNARLFSQASVLGQWLRSKPVIARVGDHLLVHGGVSEAFLDRDLDIDEANALVRPHLAARHVFMPERVRPILGPTGVTRYRGMADAAERRERDPLEHLQRLTERYGIERIAIGHTLAPHVSLQQRGLLLRLDIRHARQLPEAALYEGGVLWRVDAAGGRTLLAGSGSPRLGSPSK